MTYITQQQAADLLGVSVATIRRRIDEGDLAGYRAGKGPRGTIRVDEQAVHAYMTSRTMESLPPVG